MRVFTVHVQDSENHVTLVSPWRVEINNGVQTCHEGHQFGEFSSF